MGVRPGASTVRVQRIHEAHDNRSLSLLAIIYVTKDKPAHRLNPHDASVETRTNGTALQLSALSPIRSEKVGDPQPEASPKPLPSKSLFTPVQAALPFVG